MALRARRINNSFDLWCIVASRTLWIWVSRVSFLKSNIAGLKRPWQRGYQIRIVFLIIHSPKMNKYPDIISNYISPAWNFWNILHIGLGFCSTLSQILHSQIFYPMTLIVCDLLVCCKDITEGVTVATVVTTKFSDTLTLFQSAYDIWQKQP